MSYFRAAFLEDSSEGSHTDLMHSLTEDITLCPAGPTPQPSLKPDCTWFTVNLQQPQGLGDVTL